MGLFRSREQKALDKFSQAYWITIGQGLDLAKHQGREISNQLLRRMHKTALRSAAHYTRSDLLEYLNAAEVSDALLLQLLQRHGSQVEWDVADDRSASSGNSGLGHGHPAGGDSDRSDCGHFAPYPDGRCRACGVHISAHN